MTVWLMICQSILTESLQVSLRVILLVYHFQWLVATAGVNILVNMNQKSFLEAEQSAYVTTKTRSKQENISSSVTLKASKK
jgi:hypothetical protein